MNITYKNDVISSLPWKLAWFNYNRILQLVRWLVWFVVVVGVLRTLGERVSWACAHACTHTLSSREGQCWPEKWILLRSVYYPLPQFFVVIVMRFKLLRLFISSPRVFPGLLPFTSSIHTKWSALYTTVLIHTHHISSLYIHQIPLMPSFSSINCLSCTLQLYI